MAVRFRLTGPKVMKCESGSLTYSRDASGKKINHDRLYKPLGFSKIPARCRHVYIHTCQTLGKGKEEEEDERERERKVEENLYWSISAQLCFVQWEQSWHEIWVGTSSLSLYNNSMRARRGSWKEKKETLNFVAHSQSYNL